MKLHFYFLGLIASLCATINAMEQKPTTISIMVAYSSAERALKRTITAGAPLSKDNLSSIYQFVAGKQYPFWVNILKKSEEPVGHTVNNGDEVKEILSKFFSANDCLPEQTPEYETFLKIVLNRTHLK